jgi:hypothetical protein
MVEQKERGGNDRREDKVWSAGERRKRRGSAGGRRSGEDKVEVILQIDP